MSADAITTGKPQSSDRQVQLDFVVPVTPQEVWRALTEADEITRWFSLKAEVEPRVGGTMFWAWGDMYDETWTTRIDVWEPGRRLRLVDERVNAQGEPVVLAIDYFIETAAGGRTRFRLVHSGFGPSAEWDAEYDGVSRGWNYELRSLRHYLSRHLGRDRNMVFMRVPTRLSTAEVYARLSGPQAFNLPEPLAKLKEGDRYRTVAATGDRFEGTVENHVAPTDLSVTVEGMNDALLRYHKWMDRAYVSLATWGVPAKDVTAFEARWRPLVEKLLEA